MGGGVLNIRSTILRVPLMALVTSVLVMGVGVAEIPVPKEA